MIAIMMIQRLSDGTYGVGEVRGDIDFVFETLEAAEKFLNENGYHRDHFANQPCGTTGCITFS